MWTRIFHACPHSIDETHFFYFNGETYFGKLRVATYFNLFKMENKIRKKTLKE